MHTAYGSFDWQCDILAGIVHCYDYRDVIQGNMTVCYLGQHREVKGRQDGGKNQGLF